MSTVGEPDPEWRSYVDDDDEDEFAVPDPFAKPPPNGTEK